MTERGMIFNAEMVRAILDGRKTQTRRIMKVQPESNQLGLLLITDSTKHSDIGKYHWAESNATGNHVRSKLFLCPFGAVGDRIWVRETFCPVDDTQYDGEKWVDYRATPRYEASHPAGWDSAPNDAEALKWRPSIHMPRWASRILLEITDVRVERLNAISEEDATAEGVPPAGSLLPDYPGTFLTPKGDFATAKVAFQRLWESIYGEESWKANSWVWVISFKRVEGGAA
ncbi:TPA: morphogenetic protein [Klebsiella quasipneumoniae]|uniref:morphogenetic protein n=1 Tax=Klebsiella quasipneumoniae TaxID=1463165 RepID=UPI001ABD18ED|nr:morphogenetic protein [Klebsiella quasipneumoniae]MBO3690441.1 morphogenetic protein [Klebsiella quasipneumoniae subsp. similipneumoniae]HBW1629723.1 morphogenetic protein [Klebsiella quasipneumoniae subsp. similipneumoniae]HBW1661364.1 morphogenetic protein [Klebsiella quasipneumoniae subsp. similipneumoniae]HBW1678773.1 morphogenetic protein [Klebsiella quasipneumoniae subsp. similipneumoniae]HCM3832171.1 morphogenetic protein [Klebsiella quasipneumoniae]